MSEQPLPGYEWTEKEWRNFCQWAQAKLGLSLGEYKEAQLQRRVHSFVRRHGLDDLATLRAFLGENPSGLSLFLHEVMIHVTSFFRDPKLWSAFASAISRHTPTGEIRAWDAGCGAGQETYSLAMLLALRFPHHLFRILATDIDPISLALAQAGAFPKKAVEMLPSRLITQFFVAKDDLWEITETLRRYVQFRQHDLLHQLPPSDTFDVVLCRNVLIYFSKNAQDRIVEHLSAAMAPDGLLFVGASEQLFSPERFALVPSGPFLYRKVSVPVYTH
ncbi:MAG: protein-glutamate O-methyltransferase CheR [Firmicutes bacterium]|nr:protein-glutamate O-methyltransferase CheR [Bacillota bacterium]